MNAWLFDVETGNSVNVTNDCLNSTEFYYTEGNMSCDCNRAILFGINEYPCGNDRFYLITSKKFQWKNEES